MNYVIKSGINYSYFFQLMLVALILVLPAYATANGEVADSRNTTSISEILIDRNGDGALDLLDERVTISGRATVESSVFDDQYLMVYVQDQTAGVLVFSDTLETPVSLGDSLVVTGKLQLYKEKPEVVVDSYRVVEDKPRIPAPVSLDMAFADPSGFPGMLVKGEAVVTSKDFETNATMLRISPEDTSDRSLLAFVSRANTYHQDFNFDMLSVGDKILIEGILDKYHSEYLGETIYEVLPRTPDDIGYTGLPQQYRHYILWAGGLIMLMVVGWVVSLKRKVRYRTENISQALQQNEILMQEIHHRVKNNLAVISGILELQKHEPIDSVDLLIEDTQSRIQSIATIHEKLYQTETLSDIDMKEYIEEFSNFIMGSFNSSNTDITLTQNLQQFRLDVNTAVPLGLIINELLSNAFKHGFAKASEGEIRIVLEKKGGEAIVSVADNGEALPEDFSLDNSESLGSTLIKTFTEQIGGTIEVIQNEWTTFKITVPITET